ncbi:hypothetical protein BC937DRAFT_89367 [Endogone sp. FLAS-F59071]|nr:hypothetical protein BC937DRAFT_89367 [Endogone sp. FLAS-F59071]|eukprot:RUS17901.1 hypothetical protein BC937DRAFT_89367 [Endogone sp. FLAS-F59071]
MIWKFVHDRMIGQFVHDTAFHSIRQFVHDTTPQHSSPTIDNRLADITTLRVPGTRKRLLKIVTFPRHLSTSHSTVTLIHAEVRPPDPGSTLKPSLEIVNRWTTEQLSNYLQDFFDKKDVDILKNEEIDGRMYLKLNLDYLRGIPTNRTSPSQTVLWSFDPSNNDTPPPHPIIISGYPETLERPIRKGPRKSEVRDRAEDCA